MEYVIFSISLIKQIMGFENWIAHELDYDCQPIFLTLKINLEYKDNTITNKVRTTNIIFKHNDIKSLRRIFKMHSNHLMSVYPQ